MTIDDALHLGVQALVLCQRSYDRSRKRDAVAPLAGASGGDGVARTYQLKIDSKLTQAEQSYVRLDAQVLLAHVLNVDRAVLYAYPERTISAEQEQAFLQLIERRKQDEPVAYLVGQKAFYGLDFFVDQRVLIPRPETELLLEEAVHVVQEMHGTGRTPVIADIGTGSGIIPVTIARQVPYLPHLYATDISADALAVAHLNCQRHGVEQRVRLLQGDLLASLPEPVDILIANLPYIGTEEMNELPPDVHAYEPHLALFSGPQGLDLLHRFFVEARQSSMLQAEAVILLEIGYRQREPVAALVHDLWPYARITFMKDYAGWDRVVRVDI